MTTWKEVSELMLSYWEFYVEQCELMLHAKLQSRDLPKFYVDCLFPAEPRKYPIVNGDVN